MTRNQAIKVATMMLQAADYDNSSCFIIHPIITRKDGRTETYELISNALSFITGIPEENIYNKLVASNGNNDMIFDINDGLTEYNIKQLQSNWQNAPVYKDAKGRQYIMFNGVRTQDYCYQIIDVERYVDFMATGKHRNVDTLRKRIQRNSNAIYLDYLEDTDEIENIDPLTIQHLY